MLIRRATQSETAQILGYAVSVMAEATAGHVQPSWEKAQEMAAPFFQSGGYYLVCVERNVIYGWVGVGEIFDIHVNQPAGFLAELYVLPPYRSKGVGKKLCVEAIRLLKSQGYPKVQLNVYAGNPAKQLYERLGFHDVSTMMELDVNEGGLS